MSALNVVKAALGLGLVIFLHELGHFLLAKWNGVKVERFSIGFGPTLASWRKGVGLRIGSGSRAPAEGDPPTWGETEYVLAALPLGGYVKMLGESTGEPTEGERTSDPRAYSNKSVYARMGIITAGVITNVILGIACFAYVASQGGEEVPIIVQSVLPGSPSYEAGFRVGDEVVAIDGRRDVFFRDLMRRVNFSRSGQVVRFLVRRPDSSSEVEIGARPRRDSGANVPTIGLRMPAGLRLSAAAPYRAMPGTEMGKADPFAGLDGDYEIIAAGPAGGPIEPVGDHLALMRAFDRSRDRPIEITARPVEEGSKGGPLRSEVKVVLPVHRMLGLGFRATPGPVAAVRPGSPAEVAGLRKGDRIVGVDGDRAYDPLMLPDLARARAGRPLTLAISREGKEIEVSVTPDDSPTWMDSSADLMRPSPLDIPGLGLAMAVQPDVAGVDPASPAGKAGLAPGDILRSIALRPAATPKVPRPKEVTLRFDDGTASLPLAYAAIQEHPYASIELSTTRGSSPLSIRPVESPDRFHPDRGLDFLILTRPTPPSGFVGSLRRGVEEAVESAGLIFSLFQRMAERRIGANSIGGMIPIASVAYSAASAGIVPFVNFIGILSINLAVLNFLPIPPLDGGQFLFLVGEKVRGRPLPASLVNIGTLIGVVFVIGLILVINVKDLVVLVQGYL